MSNGIRRRRSIFSGLLLVVVGALFLYHSFQGGFEIWRVIDRWWPVVLILWGLAKLYDYWAAKNAGELPPRTVTGGEVLLVVFLFILAGIAAGKEWVGKYGPDYDIEVPWARKYTFGEEVQTRVVKAGAQISIRTDRGDIVVIPEEISEVKITARKTAIGADEAQAKERAASVKIVAAEIAGGIEIQPEVNSDNQRSVIVDLEIRVPKQTSIVAKAERGDVNVGGVAGTVRVENQRGDVNVHEIGGDVAVEIRSGDVIVRNTKGNVAIGGRGGEVEVADVAGQAVINGEYSGPITVSNAGKGARFLSRRTDLTISQLNGRFETGSGRLEISDAPGSVQLETSSYDVVLDGVTGRIRVKNRNGDIEARSGVTPQQDIELVTERGSVELGLPAKSSFELTAEARRGDIDVDKEFQALQPPEPDRRGDSRLAGKIGQRGPQITLRTSYGSIHLRKSN